MQRRQQQQFYLNPDDPGLPSDELGCSALCAAILGGGVDDELAILALDVVCLVPAAPRKLMHARAANKFTRRWIAGRTWCRVRGASTMASVRAIEVVVVLQEDTTPSATSDGGPARLRPARDRGRGASSGNDALPHPAMAAAPGFGSRDRCEGQSWRVVSRGFE